MDPICPFIGSLSRRALHNSSQCLLHHPIPLRSTLNPNFVSSLINIVLPSSSVFSSSSHKTFLISHTLSKTITSLLSLWWRLISIHWLFYFFEVFIITCYYNKSFRWTHWAGVNVLCISYGQNVLCSLLVLKWLARYNECCVIELYN